MILNSTYNNYVFHFPKGFFPLDVERRYLPFFKRLPIPFSTLTDFMSYTVQSVSWPSIATEIVEQSVELYTPKYKAGFSLDEYINKELTITMKTVEGFLNYWVMFDTLEEYWRLYNDNDKKYVPDLAVHTLDQYGYMMFTLNYKEVVFTGLSEMELSYASNVPEYKTFTATFMASRLKTTRHLD